MVRNDSACGSTIGPIIASGLGIRTVGERRAILSDAAFVNKRPSPQHSRLTPISPSSDIGNPQLSMHSIREMGGTKDVDYAVRLFVSFFKNFAAIDSSIECD